MIDKRAADARSGGGVGERTRDPFLFHDSHRAVAPMGEYTDLCIATLRRSVLGQVRLGAEQFAFTPASPNRDMLRDMLLGGDMQFLWN